MLDIKFILDNSELVQNASKNKNVNVSVEKLLTTYSKKNYLQEKFDTLKRRSNKISKEIQIADSKVKKNLVSKAVIIKKELQKLQKDFKKEEVQYKKLLDSVPNIPTDDTPIGKDEGANVVMRTVGEKSSFAFKALHHEELGVTLHLIDKKKASKIVGSRFVYFKNDLVLLEFAIVQFIFGILIDEKKLAKIFKKAHLAISSKAFIPVIPPVFVRSSVFASMGRLEPREDKYELPEDDQFLVGSAEHTLGPLHMNETIDESELPIRYLGFSTCFRREAGTYGKDMKGIIRLHQFDKLEMETFTTSADGLAEQQGLVAIQEFIMNELKLPYQVVSICTGDMGKPDAKQIDIEVWMPGMNKYLETHSADYMSDYQARRLKTYVKKETVKELAHMNDATAIAFSRIFAAIMENFQTEKGTIIIPKVLRPFMSGKKEISND